MAHQRARERPEKLEKLAEQALELSAHQRFVTIS